MHKAANPYGDNDKDKERLPIGLAYDLRKENGQLLAEIEFDQEDDFAKLIEGKVDRGFIKMCSAGLMPLTISEDPKHLLQGQKRATLAKSELFEISIADFGSNPNSLRLYDENRQMVNLSAGGNNLIPLVKQKTDNPNINNNMEFIQKVAVLLGMQPETAEATVYAELQKKVDLAQTATSLETKYNALKDEVKLSRENAIVALVDAQVDVKFTADKKEKYVKLGKDTDIETLKGILEDMPAINGKPTTLLNRQNPAGGDGGADTPEKWEDLVKLGADKVDAFKKEKKAEYIKLFKGEFGFEPEFDED